MPSIRKAAEALRARKVSCVELVQEALRAEEAHKELNCFITVTAEAALEQAKSLDAELAASQDRGLLHGVPIAHKDLYYTAGVRTTNGSRIFADYVPAHDAVTVQLLQQAGAISVGKLNMHELAYGITSTNPHYGPVRNPHDRKRVPGGSSGGSGAAVAAGIVFGTTGSDTGGSIRIPASFCGVVGFKPTYGLTSNEGCFRLGLTLDHMGPLASSVDDAALMLQGMTGTHFKLSPDAHVRMGIPENYFLDRVQPEVLAAIHAAARRAESMGAKLVPVRVPDPEGLYSTARTILLAEAATVMTPHIQPRHEFGSDVLALLDAGAAVPAVEYIRAQYARERLQSLWTSLFDDIDVLLTPTTPTVAPLIGQSIIHLEGIDEDTRLLTTRCCRGINLVGNPAISIPCGSTSAGLPMGLQIIGGLHQDQRVLNVAAALELQ